MLNTQRSPDRIQARSPDVRPADFETPAGVPPSAPAGWPQGAEELRCKAPSDPTLQLSLASGPLERAEAQHLRYLVFGMEMGARVGSQAQPFDKDEFDDFCDHLLVRDTCSGQVIGTYRILTPQRHAQLGRYYADSEFDLRGLAHLQPSLVEVGRSCVHPEHRSGAVILLLWNGLTQYMKTGGYQHLIGCASASLADGGPQAAALRDRLQAHLVPPELRVFPRVPFPHGRIPRALNPVIPPLIKGYLRLGAKVCGEPAWDPRFNCADFLIWLQLNDMKARYARRLKRDASRPVPSQA
jgi:putative hemolysin